MPWWGWVIVAVVAYAILAPIKIHLRRKRKREKPYRVKRARKRHKSSRPLRKRAGRNLPTEISSPGFLPIGTNDPRFLPTVISGPRDLPTGTNDLRVPPIAIREPRKPAADNMGLPRREGIPGDRDRKNPAKRTIRMADPKEAETGAMGIL